MSENGLVEDSSEQGETMNGTVPDFFQDESEDALRLRVNWLEQHLGLTNRFFAKLIPIDEQLFRKWRDVSVGLSKAQQAALRDFWAMILHLLSFQAFDESRVRSLFERVSPPQVKRSQSVFNPPWFGTSLKQYLQSEGCEAIEQVNRWVETFRFGDPYVTRGEPKVCPSTRR
jgi:hypothetical protein